MTATTDIRIDIPLLFGECVDQTLIDARDRTTEAGVPAAGEVAMDRTLADVFTLNLESVAVQVYRRIRGETEIFRFVPPVVFFRLREIGAQERGAAAVLVRDALKYGMLCWWYGSRDAGLYRLWAARYESALSDLKTAVSGTFARRPYSLLGI